MNTQQHTSRQMQLSHEGLDVYQAAIELFAFAHRVIHDMPAGYAYITDQFRRAALSIALNIAEGYGKSAPQEQRRYYGIARGSAMECGALVDALAALQLISDEQKDIGKQLAIRIVSMLTRMQGFAKQAQA